MNSSRKLLKKLANNRNAHIRYSIAENTSTPAEALMKLANDKSELVKEKAKQALRARGLQESKLRRIIYELYNTL